MVSCAASRNTPELRRRPETRAPWSSCTTRDSAGQTAWWQQHQISSGRATALTAPCRLAVSYVACVLTWCSLGCDPVEMTCVRFLCEMCVLPRSRWPVVKLSGWRSSRGSILPEDTGGMQPVSKLGREYRQVARAMHKPDAHRGADAAGRADARTQVSQRARIATSHLYPPTPPHAGKRHYIYAHVASPLPPSCTPLALAGHRNS